MSLNKDKIIETLRPAPKGMKAHELGLALGLDEKGRHRLRALVDELVDAGVIERAEGARLRLPGAPAGARAAPAARAITAPAAAPAPGKAPKGVVGRIRVHPAGYGFVEREDGEADVFVPARFRGPALDGDKVRLTTWVGYKGTEGRVEEVVQRGRAKLTGTVRVSGRQIYLEPDDPRIASTYGHVGLEEGAGSARDGQCVVAEITHYPTGRDSAELRARVSHVLGEAGDPRTEVLKVIACAEIPDKFPEDALAAARRVGQTLAADDFADRIDLRDRPFLTIDPETARDFDDAVCVEERERGGGFRVWVAVADVSHYVRPGTALDSEARIRGCSVYLPDRAIPMLPHELSAEICSLKPEVDRCALVVRLDTDAAGAIKDKSFCAAIIRSHARLDYPGVAAALAGDFRGPRARYQEWNDALQRMHGLAKKMRVRRRQRGALDFDLPEALVVLDEDDPRLVRDVRRSKSSAEVREAYQLIEEFMLAANEAVAEFFSERKLDTVWRVHDVPDLERLEAFAQLAEGFGVEIDVEKAQSPRTLQQALLAVAGKPYERALSFLLLRSLKQATYDVVNIGHFGLASREYLHFTSPIRRYPDLIVHRLLKYHLRKEGLPSGGSSHPPPPNREQLQAMALESSTHERRAVAAEREIVDMYRAHLMRDRVGEELGGVISGVAAFGIFVECGEPFVEGMVRTESLGEEGYEYDETRLKLVGRRSGRSFAIGDEVEVRIENVSVQRRRIEMALVSGGGQEVREERTTRRRGKPKQPDERGRKPRGKGGRRR